ncbi:MAG TPA: DUF72 domain-containing protein [Chthoniobacterales bacterium]|nr:DUF72 domain-containing protein [Chthoniobacterales bacterium]
MSTAGRILVGTASWSDPGFVERWYPKGMKAGERLGWYAQHFDMVEVNSTFYAVPEPRMVERWSAATPNDFVFDVKLHQLLSRHSAQAKMLPPDLQRRAEVDENGRVKLTPKIEEAVARVFLASIEPLRRDGKLGALLLQLSPAFSPRKHRLDELEQLIAATRHYRLAIELRNRNWVVGEQLARTLEFLSRHRIAFVNVDAPNAEHFTIIPSELNEVTSPELAYLRLHGRNAKAYLTGKTVGARFNYDYSPGEVKEIAKRSQKLGKQAQQVHVIFNNNALDYAPRAAIRLREALGQVLKTPPETPELF